MNGFRVSFTGQGLNRSETHRLSGRPIYIDERPVVFWDVDHSEIQRKFLDSIDTGYFHYQAQIHEARLEGERKESAAIALRFAYSHALETLFALVGAALQAPHCPAGWMLQYKLVELVGVIRKISTGELKYRKLVWEKPGWPGVADLLFPWTSDDPRVDQTRILSGRLWYDLAKQFTDETLSEEYNSLKHGMRSRSQAWHLAMGREDSRGVLAPPERMRLLSENDHGSTFVRATKIKNKKYQWRFEEQRVNWDPLVIARRLPLIAASIGNLVSFMKHLNGEPIEELTVYPILEEDFITAMTSFAGTGMHKFGMWTMVDPETIPDVSPEEILRKYQENDTGTG